MTVFEHAKLYYPKYWNKSRILKLFEAGKLTEAEYKEIIESEVSG